MYEWLHVTPVSRKVASIMLGIRAVCLWPGLPGAWVRGRVQQLLLALAATWIFSFLLLATFVWPAWVGSGSLRALWAGAGIGWLWFSLRGHWQYAGMQRVSAPEQAVAFTQAQEEYLRGNWFAAEARLLAILQAESRDVEALLLLISVLRQTRRWQPALRRLKQMELLDGAHPWRHEVAREKVLIERAIAAASEAEGSEAVDRHVAGDLRDGSADDPTEDQFEGQSENQTEDPTATEQLLAEDPQREARGGRNCRTHHRDCG